MDGVHFPTLDVILLKEKKALHCVQQFVGHRVLWDADGLPAWAEHDADGVTDTGFSM